MELIKKNLLEFVEGTSNKFWEISLYKDKFTNTLHVKTRWGKRDNKKFKNWKEDGGTTSTLKVFPANKEFYANRLYGDKLRGKIEKGYKGVSVQSKKTGKALSKAKIELEDETLSRFNLMMDDF